MRYTKVAWLFLVSVMIGSCRKETVAPTNEYVVETVQYKEINGVAEDLLSLDVYHFNEPDLTRPTIVYVHGGAWAIGDKSNNLENRTMVG